MQLADDDASMRSVTQVRPRVSYAELERWPDDGRRFELYDGELFEMPSPTLRHQTVVLNVASLLREYAGRHGGRVVIAPFDIILTPYDVLQPDVVYFSPGRARRLTPEGRGTIAPDLAVEIVSPSTLQNDRGRKMDLLARHGVREYWLVDPVRHTLERYEPDRGLLTLASVIERCGTLESPFFPGLSVPGAGVFAD